MPAKKNTRVRREYLFLLGILMLAAGFRFLNIDWDQGKHLHPDERFLSMLVAGISWPNATDYFDYEQSPLNPHKQTNFFIYGTFPVFLVKTVGDSIGYAGYGQYTLLGRILSALFDMGTILLLFFIGRILFNTTMGLLGALLLAGTVIHIQHAHFFVVDLFVTFFLMLAFFLLLRFMDSGKWQYAGASGIAWGFALASKISSVFFAPIIFLALLLFFLKKTILVFTRKKKRYAQPLRNTQYAVFCGLLLVLLTFAVFRIAQPYAFTGPSVWNVNLSQGFVASYQQQQAFNDPSSRYPPTYQWQHRSPFFQLTNLVLWGLGLPLSILALLGILAAICRLLIKKDWHLILPLSLLAAWILFHAVQFIKFTRYLLPVTPLLALFAAFSIVQTVAFVRHQYKDNRIALVVGVVLVSSCFLWPLAFAHIYTEEHPRIAASRWIAKNIDANTTLAIEHWDDELPFQLRDESFLPAYHKEELRLYESDTDKKMHTVTEQLARTDYIILSSNRLSGSISRIPEWYPYTSRYYQLLFNGSLGFVLEKEFTNYPSLFGITINDEVTEEAFTVYDHPQVRIFKKTTPLSSDKLQSLLQTPAES